MYRMQRKLSRIRRRKTSYSFKPWVTFVKRDGKTFTKRFTSRDNASRAIRGWRAKGGRIRNSG